MPPLLFSITLGALGGIVFYYLRLPLPWTLGPLAAVLGYKLIGSRQVVWPARLRNLSFMILGIVMGSPFTLDTARQILAQWPAIVSSTVAMVVCSLGIGYITHKRSGIDLSSCLLGSVPGGLSQMVLLSQENPRANTTIVTFMQSARLLASLFVVPFLALHGLSDTVVVNLQVAAGSSVGLDVWFITLTAVAAGTAIAVRCKVPTPWLLGPILTAAFLVCRGMEAVPMPGWMLGAAQISAGLYMGSNIDITSLADNWRRVFFYTLSGVAGILCCSFIIGYVLKQICGYSLVTAFLGTAPGGIGEMGLTAMMVQADLSVVIAYQIFRLFFVLLVVPYYLRWQLQRI